MRGSTVSIVIPSLCSVNTNKELELFYLCHINAIEKVPSKFSFSVFCSVFQMGK